MSDFTCSFTHHQTLRFGRHGSSELVRFERIRHPALLGFTLDSEDAGVRLQLGGGSQVKRLVRLLLRHLRSAVRHLLSTGCTKGEIYKSSVSVHTCVYLHLVSKTALMVSDFLCVVLICLFRRK